MKKKRLRFSKGFRVVVNDRQSQAAVMVLSPGDREGGPGNKHRGSDQWLFVEDGHGEAIINGRTYKLRKNLLLLIKRGDRHEIRNTSRRMLKTLNFYLPPAYTEDGDENRVVRDDSRSSNAQE